MSDFPGPARFWRLVILVPIPYFAAVAFAWSGDRGGFVMGALVGVASLAFASLMWARARGLRIAGYIGHALALTAAFGVGGVLALLNALGGLHGERGGPLWFTLVLGAGATLSILCLLPLAAVIVADWSRQGQG